jgi:isoleucyl-tRNA synthetase
MSDDLFDVLGNISLPKEEERILELWAKLDAFQTSLKKSEGKKEFSFYDGPPFATGLPHHGHVLAGFIKDIVTRYAHMTGELTLTLFLTTLRTPCGKTFWLGLSRIAH